MPFLKIFVIIIFGTFLSYFSNEKNAKTGCLPFMERKTLTEAVDFPLGGIKSFNGITFSPDGCLLYITQDINGKAKIFETRLVDGAWSAPVLVENLASEYHDYQPRLSPDGNRLYFNSSRPMPDGKVHEGLRKIWVSERVGNDWGVPRFLTGVNSSDPWDNDSYPAILADGSIYFRSVNDLLNPGNANVSFSRYSEGLYLDPVAIPEVSQGDVNDLFVSPDGRIMILNKWIEEEQDVDLEISFRTKTGWTTPRKLEILDTPEMELTPTLSPDGLYFLFERRGVTKIISFEVLLSKEERDSQEVPFSVKEK